MLPDSSELAITLIISTFIKSDKPIPETGREFIN
jgi:hypothetical protein